MKAYRLRVIVEDDKGNILDSEDIGSSDDRGRVVDGMFEVSESVSTLFEDCGLEDLQDLSTTVGGGKRKTDFEYIANSILADYRATVTIRRSFDSTPIEREST